MPLPRAWQPAGVFALAAAVSKNVITLETELGVRLFNRNTRRIRLTPEGEDFAEKARAVLRALDDPVAGVSQGQAVPAGRVRISVGASFGRGYVLPVLPELLAAYPKLEIEVSLDNRTVDLVGEGYDIGIRGGRARDSSLVSRLVCALPLVLLASPGYLSRRGTPRSADDLHYGLTHHRYRARCIHAGSRTCLAHAQPRQRRCC